tara:strand:+ start:207 stop:638 length:432 start_codon:yes stop_codon:yes gene_type:complete
MAHPKRIFKEPKDLLKVWVEYKANIAEKETEWKKVQYVGKDGSRVTDSVKIPYTLEGLKRYCWDENIGCIEQYFTNQDEHYNDFLGVCSRIKNEIREHQITGGMNGFFNPSITQRLNGLTDKKELEMKGGIKIPNLPDIGNRE